MKCKNHVADLAAIQIIVKRQRLDEPARNFTRAGRRADAKKLLDSVQSRGLQLSPDVRRWLLEATDYQAGLIVISRPEQIRTAAAESGGFEGGCGGRRLRRPAALRRDQGGEGRRRPKRRTRS